MVVGELESELGLGLDANELVSCQTRCDLR